MILVTPWPTVVVQRLQQQRQMPSKVQEGCQMLAPQLLHPLQQQQQKVLLMPRGLMPQVHRSSQQTRTTKAAARQGSMVMALLVLQLVTMLLLSLTVQCRGTQRQQPRC